MPPHSEASFSEVGQIEFRKRRKRSRSISPGQLSRSSEFGGSKKINRSNRSSRSSSVASEVRSPFSPVYETFAAVAKSMKQRNVTKPAIVNFHEAPSFLQFNPFIYRGYRTNLCTYTCLKSMFWWTNETINTWTHLFGWLYFGYFTVEEVRQSIGSESSSTWQDGVMMIIILVCFQICMAMSTGYHTFCCHSKDLYHCWLSYDLCGISFSLLAIYTTGIYYAFWCDDMVRNIYLGISALMFGAALILQTTPKFLGDDYSNIRLVFFMCWSVFGVIPCLHWVFENGGFSSPNVLDLMSQIGIMYLICGLALFFYVTRIPEIWFPGCVDYIGSSHQWWHVIIFYAFYHWHCTGKYYAEYRAHHGCFEELLSNSNFTEVLQS